MECFLDPQEEEIVKGKFAGTPLLALALLALAAAPAFGHNGHDGHGGLGRIGHIVVIYEENHSFDNLYGMWEGVDGLNRADAAHTLQVSQAGTPYECLLQDDVNLTPPQVDSACTDAHPGGAPAPSHFTNAPFTIDDYIKPTDTTCPPPGDS